MNLQERIELMAWLGNYMVADGPEWQEAKLRAEQENAWFTQQFISEAARNICENYLDRNILKNWAEKYSVAPEDTGLLIGIVMAGNIPLVGFHDLLCTFIAGHRQYIKLSARDTVLMKHLVEILHAKEPLTKQLIHISERLNGCDAYIATGSNNTSRYFEYYFSKYPHIIRRNRTSVAIISGEETVEALAGLSDDVNLYFGLGCRNVTKIYVPRNYSFLPLLEAFNKYDYLANHHKYKNNYDYQLSILLLNSQMYMTNGSVLLTENEGLFSPISQVFYETYSSKKNLQEHLSLSNEIQSISTGLSLGNSQKPSIDQYADGIDTMAFLTGLREVRKSL